ncbi:hypothetical protein [Kineosporia succinea]|uniref:Uncharacterized protein n=1 Tax=Kineosporia succinea TaxID=84632 RepID=A0ABT9PE34_9ACTN|nr:hypothetical protein [Kineosporia succinea]MDP9830240.1 hypothetical protein [Kineosporia succinea]
MPVAAPVVAVKCYGYEWHTRYGLSDVQAADRMAAHGVDWALIQNSLDPLPTSDVDQAPPTADYDDVRFRDRLRENGIRVFESSSVFFHPEANARDPRLRPVGDDGRVMSPFDWYLGASPTSRSYLAERAETVEKAVSAYQPDGVFLLFIRFPNFWEAWTPVVRREDIVEYCFSPDSLERFTEDTGIELPAGPAIETARYITNELRQEWTRWKCDVITDAVATIQASAVRARPGTEIMINGVAFSAHDRGNLAHEILGQDLGAISQHAEHVETMVYHQILARDPQTWIPEILHELRPSVKGTLLASIQTTAAYTDPPHHDRGRSPYLPPQEFAAALSGVAAGGADGVSVYHWTDVLADEVTGDGVMVDALRRYKDGSL